MKMTVMMWFTLFWCSGFTAWGMQRTYEHVQDGGTWMPLFLFGFTIYMLFQCIRVGLLIQIRQRLKDKEREEAR